MGLELVSKRELRVKTLIELPFMLLIFFIALGFGHKGWWAYISILIIGWYLSSLAYWNLYKNLMLNKIPQSRFKFYSYLIGFQAIFIGIAIYILIP